MPWTLITVPTQGKGTRVSFAQAVIDDLAYLYGRSNTATTQTNGSFEDDVDADGIPDGWTRTLFTGGTFLLDTTDQRHGLNSIKFTSPGGASNGGGRVDSTDPFPVSPNRVLRALWEMKSSAAGVSNQVEIYWFKSDLTASATPSTTLYTSTANPTSWTAKSAFATPPSDARYAKVRLTGCSTASTTAGSTWFDNLIVSMDRTIPTMEVLTASGNWTCPIGVHYVEIEAWGGGGGNYNGGGTAANGTGGGGGEYSTGKYAVTPGTVYAYVIGTGGPGGVGSTGTAGGNTSLGSLVAANGGAAGAPGAGGAGGTGGAGGQISIPGRVGNSGSASVPISGGSSPRGGFGGFFDVAGDIPGGGGGSGNNAARAGADGRIVLRY